MKKKELEALETIRRAGGMLRTSAALREGIHPRTLYALRDAGMLEPITRGVFRLSEREASSHPDLVAVAARVPRAVICLVSALSFHGLTSQIPHTISIAVERGSRPPRFDHPPVTVHYFSPRSFRAGIEEHPADGVLLRVFCPEKTLVDCFKFRNKIGMDVFLEALKRYRSDRRPLIEVILDFARICRVERRMSPYLEASL